jgi:hypothetical protein
MKTPYRSRTLLEDLARERVLEIASRIVYIAMGVLIVLAVTSLSLSSCPSPGLHYSLTGARSQEGYSVLGSGQPCLRAAEVLEVYDLALAAVVLEARRAGVPLRDNNDLRQDKRGACLIEEPAECRGGGVRLGPCTADGKLCARRRGCHFDGFFWVARQWPPVCRAGWPDEPNCVSAGAPRTTTWVNDFVHEVGHVVDEAQDAEHKGKLFSAGGAVDRAAAVVRGVVWTGL